jgi:S-DNA-T family DNA segregation ATPase FtsK/SpoIIIE
MNIKRLPSPWPDPLPDHITLPDLLRQEGYAGWNGTSWVFDSIDIASSTSPPPPRAPACPNRPWLRAMLGLQDDPAHQRQIPLQLDLTQQDGHLVVIGAPGSGKEMWMRTLITSLARTHAPDELHFYLLEFSGAALQVFKNLPHAGGDILTPLDDERVPRLFRLLIDALDERKSLCSKAGVDGLVRLRKLQPDQAPPAIVMVIAGFAEFRTIFQEEMGQLTRLIREGGPFGIHVVLVGDRAGDIPIAISSVVARRVVLRLADTDEYSMVLGTRIKFSQEQRFPLGRGWYGRPPLEFQTASPGHKKDENAQIAELQQIVDKMEHVVEETRQDWQDKLPLPVIELPPIVPLAQLLSSVSPPSPLSLSVPIGLDYLRTQPALIDLINDGPNFMVSSTARGGKTTLLLTWALALAEHNSPLQVQFVLIAGRRNSLWPLEGLPHVLNYCEKPDNFVRDGVLAKLQAEIQRREILLSDSSSDPGKLPHIVVMFDDYDEFSNAVGGQKEVKEGLDKLAKRGRDVEIHSIATGPSLRNLGVSLHNDPMTTQLKIGRSGFVLQIRDANEQNPLELRIRPAELKQMPPGRGYVTRRGSEEMLQVATVGDGAEVASWVAELRQRWNDEATPAEWPKTLENQAEKETAMT